MPVSDNISDFLLGLLADNPGSFFVFFNLFWSYISRTILSNLSTGQMEKGSSRLQLQAKPLYEHVPGVHVNNASAQVAKFMSTLLIW